MGGKLGGGSFHRQQWKIRWHWRRGRRGKKPQTATSRFSELMAIAKRSRGQGGGIGISLLWTGIVPKRGY
jgi:hypothetical protein